jgi:hypothetical protein
MMKKLLCLLVMPILLLITSCGGDDSSNDGSTTSQQYSTAVLKVSSQGTLSQANSIVGIDATLSIPVGVSLKTDLSGKADIEWTP